MEDANSILPFFLACITIIVLGTWFVFAIRIFVLCWKHDSYVKKNFPKSYQKESISVFGGNWNGISILENLFSKTAPDKYVSLIRKKVCCAWFGALLSVSLLPMGLFLLLIFIMALAYVLGYSL